jgi:hypothetical protein
VAMSRTWPALYYHPTYYHPTAVEVAQGFVTGLLDTPDPVAQWYQSLPRDATPRSVLEELVRCGLERSPCVISFSGGRDSSALLAVSTLVARREGLPLPVAVTFRYEGEAETEEREWQELVVRHVGVEDWQTLDIGDGHDILSPLTLKFVRAHGLVLPASLPAKIPLHLIARGGSVMSGEGGDEIFGRRRATVLRHLAGKPPRLLRARSRREARQHLGPYRTRFAALRRHVHRVLSAPLGYLRPAFREQVFNDIAAHLASEPFDNTKSLGWHLRRKLIVKHQESLAALADDHGVQHLDPFLQPSFVAAYARMVRPFGLPTRTDAMIALFSDLLPAEVLRRESKAIFNRAMISDASRQFARAWRGGGVDTELVDPDALRAAWLSDWPPVQSMWLLQSAWLYENEEAPASR